MMAHILRLMLAVFVLSAPLGGVVAKEDQHRSIVFRIAPQSLDSALVQFSDQSGVQLVVTADTVRGKSTRGVEGSLELTKALARLLEGSGLQYRMVNAKSFAIVGSEELTLVPEGAQMTLARNAGAEGAPDSRKSPQHRNPSGVAMETSGSKDVQEIVVIGTNIRGVYPASSPVQIYTAQDIARTGATTTEQFINKLTQNFASTTQNAPGSGERSSPIGANGVDLRGLGRGTTLVLLNGRRLTSGSSSARFVDISLIPVNAISHVEVLTDGASAIYGSDAIGGVVNFVLQDDIEGAQTALSYGSVTDGGLRQMNFGQNVGTHWSSGHGLLAYNFLDASSLENSERDYAAAAGPGTLTPDDRRHTFFATLEQTITPRLTLSADIGHGWRDTTTSFPLSTNLTQSADYDVDVKQLFVNGAADYRIAGDMTASLVASYSTTDYSSRLIQTSANAIGDENEFTLLDLTAKIDGTLFPIPGGDVKFSLGAGRLEEESSTVNGFIGAATTAHDYGRRTDNAFGEVFVPLVSPGQGIAFASRLELSLAGRYTGFKDISEPRIDGKTEDAFSPKIGLLWAPMEQLSLRATYGESFRAPDLTLQDPSAAFNLFLPSSLVGVSPSFPVLIAGGGNPNLDPEQAKSYTFGFDFRPASAPNLRLSATYFDISYTDKVGLADPSGGTTIIFNPANYPDSAFFSPGAAELQTVLSNTRNLFNLTGIAVDFSNPAGATATLAGLPNLLFIDNRSLNLASADVSGLDVTMEHGFDTAWGDLSAGATVTYLRDSTQRGRARAPLITIVDTVQNPVDLRARTHVSLSRGALNTTLNLNYVDDYEDPLAPVNSRAIASWTTLDWVLTYDLAKVRSRLLEGARINLGIQNMLDKDPPFVARSTVSSVGVFTPIGFDAANANPLGRFVTVGISKSW